MPGGFLSTVMSMQASTEFQDHSQVRREVLGETLGAERQATSHAAVYWGQSF